MSIVWNRTSFDDDATKVFHVCNSTTTGGPSATAYSDLAAKFGGDYVFRSDNLDALQAALNRTVSGRHDKVLIYPGTYTDDSDTDATAVTISTSDVTIESATGNPASVKLDAGSDCELISIAATADGVIIRNMTIVLDASATTPQDSIEVISGAVGVIIENVTFVGADKASVAIDSEGDRLQVINCRFEDVKTAIQSNGNYCKIKGNYINSDNTGAVGIEVTAAAAWNEITDNVLDLSGGTGDVGIKLHTSSVLGICKGNIIHASCNDPILPNSSTMAIFGNYKTGSVTTDFTITNSTVIPGLIYT